MPAISLSSPCHHRLPSPKSKFLMHGHPGFDFKDVLTDTKIP